MSAKLVLTHNYIYMRLFWNGFAIGFEPTRKSVLDIVRSYSVSIRSISESWFGLWKHERGTLPVRVRICHKGIG